MPAHRCYAPFLDEHKRTTDEEILITVLLITNHWLLNYGPFRPPHGYCITNFRARRQDRRSSGQNSSVDPAGAYRLGQIDSGAADPARPRLIWRWPNRCASAETATDSIACRSKRRRTGGD